MRPDITEALVYATDDPLHAIVPLAATDGFARMAGLMEPPAAGSADTPGLAERLADAALWRARIEPADLGELHRLARSVRLDSHASVSYRLGSLPGDGRAWVSDLLVRAVPGPEGGPRYHGVRTLHGDDGAGAAPAGEETLSHALAGFIHAIRQPLNRIGLAVANARLELERGTESRDYLDTKLERIGRSAEQAAGLLHDLPALARGREHASATRHYPLAALLEALATAGVARSRPVATQGGLPDGCTLRCGADPGMLAALVHALADEAFPRASGAGAAGDAALTVACQRHGNRVQLTLSTPAATGAPREALVAALARVLARLDVDCDLEAAAPARLRLALLAE